MDSTQSSPAVKQKKGIKRLWVKIKASLRSGSSKTQPSTTTTTTTPASDTLASRPTQTAASGTAVTEPPAQAAITKRSDPQNAVEDPSAQSQPASGQAPETTKAGPEPPRQTASTLVQTPEPSTTIEEATSQPETANEPKTAKPWDRAALASDVIEVDENEDAEESSYVNTSMQHYIANFSSIQAPQIDIAGASAEDKAKYQEAQALFQKYNMTLDPANWHAQSKSNIERVHKKKRQRVHWTCHECKSTFGREKICSRCSHLRCSTCVRYPPKKVGEKAQQRSKPVPVAASASAPGIPTTGACHECKTEFSIGAPSCKNCDHEICERCLQETVIASPATSPPSARIENAVAA